MPKNKTKKTPIQSSFFARETILVAQELLGKLLVHEVDGIVRSGIIVETEAYTGNDPACHAYRGKTERNASLFGPVGHAYVYFIYGNHFCLNTVARTKDIISGGVLIRALEPIAGIDLMKKARKMNSLKNLTNGPGKLTQALGINRSFNGLDLTIGNNLYLTEGIQVKKREIKATPRIGISQAKENLWRFIIKGNEFISK